MQKRSPAKKIAICFICSIMMIFLITYVVINANCRLIIRNGVLVELWEGIFQKKDEITTIKIPDGVTSIGERAFSSYIYLRSVEIPESVTEIGEEAFYFCFDLEKVNIPNGVETIKHGTFYACLALKEIELPNSITKIESYAFWGAQLSQIELPDGLTSIGDGAFEYCLSLTEVKIPTNVMHIGEDAFLSTDWQSSFEWDEDNCLYGDNVLLDTWKSWAAMDVDDVMMAQVLDRYKQVDEESSRDQILLYIEEGADHRKIKLVIPTKIKVREGTRVIANAAFGQYTCLLQVELPESLESIGDRAFFDCKYLKQIEIPDRVKIIGKDVFEGCEALEMIRLPWHLKDSFIYEGEASVIYY